MRPRRRGRLEGRHRPGALGGGGGGDDGRPPGRRRLSAVGDQMAETRVLVPSPETLAMLERKRPAWDGIGCFLCGWILEDLADHGKLTGYPLDTNDKAVFPVDGMLKHVTLEKGTYNEGNDGGQPDGNRTLARGPLSGGLREGARGGIPAGPGRHADAGGGGVSRRGAQGTGPGMGLGLGKDGRSVQENGPARSGQADLPGMRPGDGTPAVEAGRKGRRRVDAPSGKGRPAG